MLSNDAIALVITFLLSITWLRVNDTIAHRGWVSSQVSRKIIHAGTGPIFVLCWLLFRDDLISAFLASIVPLLITAQFFLVGAGLIRDEAAVQAMSRSGDRREILRGPLYYGIIFVLITIIYWKNTPIGIAALMLMCGGDGLADIIGRRYGKAVIPWNRTKTWAGSLGMFLGGFIFSAGIILIFISAGVFQISIPLTLLILSIIALAGTLVESLPLPNIDNITVTLTAVILGHLLF